MWNYLKVVKFYGFRRFFDANFYNDKAKEEIEKSLIKLKKLKKEKEHLKIVGSQITDSNYISMKSTSEYNELKQLRRSLSIAIKSYKKQFTDDIHFVDEVVVDNDFNKNLSYIQLIQLKIGDAFCQNCKYIFWFENEKVILEKIEMIVDIVKKREKNEFGNMSKEMFLKRIAEFHIGEWEKSINCKALCDGTYAEIVFTYDNGQKIKYEFENDYPYNFRFFLQFIKGKDFETLN